MAVLAKSFGSPEKNMKLRQIWTGSWKIEQFISPLVVKVQHTRSNKTLTVQIDRLAPCHLPSPEIEQETQPKQLVEPESERRLHPYKKTSILFGFVHLNPNG